MPEFSRSTALSHVEVRRSRQDSRCYRPHAHDVLSIGLIDAGTSMLTGAPGGPVRLTEGDVIVIAAGQVHACNPDGGPWRYRMVHLDQDWAVPLMPHRHASGLLTGISVLRRADLHHSFDGLSDAVFADEPAERIEAGFRDLFRRLDAAVPEHRVVRQTDPELLARLHPVLECLRQPGPTPALAELAQLVGMSTDQLIRAVKRATGLAPLAWRQNARVLAARRLLRGGRQIADTAYALGFTDQSHFHRIFRAHVAASPGAYRR